MLDFTSSGELWCLLSRSRLFWYWNGSTLGTCGKQTGLIEAPVLQLKVRGPGVRSGKIPVPDLIRICADLQNAVRRQAEALEGRKTIHPGPTTLQIREECTLELIGIKKGTTTLNFGITKPQIPLPFGDASAFGEVVAELASSIDSLGNGNRHEIDPGVLQSLYSLGGVLETSRISEIEWIVPKRGNIRRAKATFNPAVRERVAARLSAPRRISAHVDGILGMADFKPKDRKCRIDPAIGGSVMCSYKPELENQVYALLRQPVRVTGIASLQPYTDKIELIDMESVEPLPSISLGAGNFFAAYSLTELATVQGIKPIRDTSILVGGFPEDEDVDDFLTEIYGSRR